MNRVIRKPVFIICKYQGRRWDCASTESDKSLLMLTTSIDNSSISIFRYSKKQQHETSAYLSVTTVCKPVASDLVGKPEDRFPFNDAHKVGVNKHERLGMYIFISTFPTLH